MEEYEDVGRNALIAYDATDATTATTATMEGQEQEAVSQSLQTACQSELETERTQLGNPGVLKPISGNAVIRKAKAETRHGAKDRSSNLAALRMIARQGADEKSQLEEWKAVILDSLTKEIAQIHRVHNNAMEAQREEIENQREQFQWEIEVLRERILDLERERKKEGSVQEHTRKPGPAQNTPKKAHITNDNQVADLALGKELAQSNHANTTPQRSSKASNLVTIPSSPPYQPRQNQPSSTPNQLKQTQPATSPTRKSYA